MKFPLDQEFDVRKGDSFVFYCDSGLAHSNSSDSSGCPFEITYFPGADYEADAELSGYLRAGARRATSEAFSISKGDSARK